MRSPAFLLLCGLTLACGSSPADKAPEAASQRAIHTAPAFSLPKEFTGQQSALQDFALLGKMPDSTMAAVVGKSIEHVSQSLGWLEIVSEYKGLFAEMNLALGTDSKAKFLEPATWSELGIDTKAPFGAAFIVEKRAVGLFFAPLADAKLFRSKLPEVAKALGLGTYKIGVGIHTDIVRFEDDEVALLLDGQSVVLLLADRSKDIDVVAKAMRAVEPKNLASSGRIAKIFTKFDYGEDVAGFVAFDTFAKRLSVDQERNSHDSYWRDRLETLERRLEESKSLGKPQTEIDELEEQITEISREFNARALRDAGEAHFTGNILGSLGVVAFGADLAGKKTGMRVRLDPHANTFAKRLFLEGAGPLALPKRLSQSPIVMLAAHVQKKAATELFRTVLNMDGKTMRGLSSAVKGEFQLDLQEILELLGGEISGAITLDKSALLKAKTTSDIVDAFNLHLLFEIRDEAAAKSLVASALAAPGLAPYLVGEGDSAAIEVPSFNNHPVRLSLSGRYIEARSTGPTSSEPIWRTHEESPVGSAHALGLLVLDPMLLSWLTLADYETETHEAFATRRDQAGSGKSPPDTPLQVETRMALAKLDEQIAKVREKTRSLLSREFVRRSQAIGRLVATVHREKSGPLALIGSVVGETEHLGHSFQLLIESLYERLEEERTGKPSMQQELISETMELIARRRRLSRKLH